MEITYEMLQFVMVHWALYAMFFLFGMIFTITLLFIVKWAPALWQSFRTADFIKKYMKFLKNEVKK